MQAGVQKASMCFGPQWFYRFGRLDSYFIILGWQYVLRTDNAQAAYGTDVIAT
jgi:hypothetical protein